MFARCLLDRVNGVLHSTDFDWLWMIYCTTSCAASVQRMESQ